MFYSTRAVPENMRADSAKEVIENLCGPLSANFNQAGKSLLGIIDTRKVGSFNCSRVEQPANKISRSQNEINKGVPNYYILIIQLSGTCECTQNNNSIFLNPGMVTILNSTSPFDLEFSPKTVQFILHIPKSVLDNTNISWNEHILRACQPETATLLKALILSSFELDKSDSSHEQTIDKTIINLLCGDYRNKINSSVSELTLDKDSNQITLIRNYLLNHLTDPKLSPKQAAQSLGWSERQLHRIFQVSGLSICRWIKQTRLDRCALALSDHKQNHRRISEIAHFWGFSDAAHFSRTFHEEYGQTPREYRQVSQSN